jgi:hypothetical protein
MNLSAQKNKKDCALLVAMFRFSFSEIQRNKLPKGQAPKGQAPKG